MWKTQEMVHLKSFNTVAVDIAHSRYSSRFESLGISVIKYKISKKRCMCLHIVRSFINVSNAKSFTILSPGGSSWEGPIRQYELLPGLTWNFTILDLQIDHGLSNSMLLKGLSRLVTICCKIAVRQLLKTTRKISIFFQRIPPSQVTGDNWGNR